MIDTGLTTELCWPGLEAHHSAPSDVRCGDLLLAFQETQGPIPSRYTDTNWKASLSADGWQLLHNHPGYAWRGYPFSVGEVQEWNFVLLGELYGVDRNSDRLLNTLHSVVTGRKSAAVLNGHFLLLAYDQENRHWQVFTDRFGTFHAYYGSDGRRCALGTFSPAVVAAASRKQLDWTALRIFFAQGFFPGQKTFYQDVQILRPATRYVFDAAGKMVEHKRYWQWWHDPNPNRTYDETIDEFAACLRVVMRDHMRVGRVALPISGGLDSRSTAAVADSATTAEFGNLWTYSYGYTDDSPETSIARRIAGARGLPFQAFTIQPYLFQKLNLVLDSVEGFQDITQCRQAAVLEQIAENADYVIAAHWGDVWLDTMGLSEADVDVRSTGCDWQDDDIVKHTLKKVRKSGSEWLLENVCPNGSNGEECLREPIQQELAKVKGIECADFRVKAFKTDNWSFRWTTGSLRMFHPAAFPRLPFYDTRLTDFFCTVPARFLHGRRLQVDYLKRYAPDLARITWQAHGANLLDYQKPAKVWRKRAARKAWRWLNGKKPIERNWETQLLNSQGRLGLNALLIKRGLRLHEAVPLEKVKRLLDRFYVDSHSEKRGYTVSMLLTLSAWLEKYG